MDDSIIQASFEIEKRIAVGAYIANMRQEFPYDLSSLPFGEVEADEIQPTYEDESEKGVILHFRQRQ